MHSSFRGIVTVGLAAFAVGCASTGARTDDPDARRGAGAMPPIPAVDGPLDLSVAYPPAGATIATDSNFIFGATGSGRAALSINGIPVNVAPNGGWLAFIPVPADGVYRIQATKDGQTATLEHSIRARAAAQAGPARVRITNVTPTGAIAVWEGENVAISFTGTAGGQGYLLLPDGRRIPLIETRAAAAAANNAADFQVNPNATVSNTVSRYEGVFPASALRTRDTAVAQPSVGELPTLVQLDSVRRAAAVQLIVGNDTVSTPLNLNLSTIRMARVGVVNDRTGRGAQPSFRIRGRPALGGPFHYFWPHGTLLTVTGQRGDYYRVHLTGDLHAWVPVGDVQLLAGGVGTPAGVVYGVRMSPQAGYIDLRIPAGERLPYHVEETEYGLQIDVYGATSAVNFFQYGKLDPLIERAMWSQPRDSVFRVNVELTKPVWGYDAFHDGGGAVVLRIRRPPEINAQRPLQGMVVVVDPGHGGQDSTTRGPTSFTEADANLAISLQLRPLLEAAGARIIMTRSTDVFIPLGDRPQMAADSNAHILVSVHNNAFPDGVNPFVNNGTSTYYYHAHSVDLAQSFQRELLRELGLNDIGYGRADLALVRPTWMPAALTETSFMMIPEQEAALQNVDWQRRIAQAHVRGLEAFLRERAGAAR